MMPKIDQFYTSPETGVFKFVGYDRDGAALIDKYGVSPFTRGEYTGWLRLNRVRVSLQKLVGHLRARRIRPIPPPA